MGIALSTNAGLNLHLLLLGRQAGCRCGRTYVPTRGVVEHLRTEPISLTCVCGEIFDLLDGYVREMTHDYTREAHLAFLSNWAQQSFLDVDDETAAVRVRFDGDLPDEVFAVLLQPAVTVPKALGADALTALNAAATMSACVDHVDRSGFTCVASNPEIRMRLSIAWTAYGRRGSSPRPAWWELMRQAQLIEHGGIFDAAIGMYHSCAEAFIGALLTERLTNREQVTPEEAAAEVERAGRKLTESERQRGEVVGLVEHFANRAGVPSVVGSEVESAWQLVVRGPRNKIFHGSALYAGKEDARLAFAATLGLFAYLDRRTIADLVLEAYPSGAAGEREAAPS